MWVTLGREYVLCRSKWIGVINHVTANLRWIWPPSLVRNTTGFKTLISPCCAEKLHIVVHDVAFLLS